MDLWRTSGCFVRSDEGQPRYMIVSCDRDICSEYTVQLRSQKLHCTKGSWDGGFNGLNRRQRRSQTQLLAFLIHTINTHWLSIQVSVVRAVTVRTN